MAAALCVELNIQPQELPVRQLQEALLEDAIAPAAIIPLLNLPPNHPQWLQWQRYYLDRPEAYPQTGICPCDGSFSSEIEVGEYYTGTFRRIAPNGYRIRLTEGSAKKKIWSLITVRPEVNEKLENCTEGAAISVWGTCNDSGGWLLVEKVVIPGEHEN